MAIIASYRLQCQFDRSIPPPDTSKIITGFCAGTMERLSKREVFADFVRYGGIALP
jgi:hypothetical protein